MYTYLGIEAEAFTLYNKALTLQRQGQITQAEDVFEELLDHEFIIEASKLVEDGLEGAVHPGLQLLYSIHKNMAAMALHRGDNQAAMKSYIEAVNIDESEVTVWYKMGMIALKLVNYPLARLGFEQGLQCNPNHWPCLDNVITVLYTVNDYLNCLYYISRALEKDCMYTKGLVIRHQIYKEQLSLKEDTKEFFTQCDSSINIYDVDKEEADEYIKEALDMRKRRRELTKVPDPLPITLPKLTSYTWKCLGESLINLYDSSKNANPPKSLGLRVDLSEYANVTVESLKTPLQKVVAESSQDVIEEKMDVTDSKEIVPEQLPSDSDVVMEIDDKENTAVAVPPSAPSDVFPAVTVPPSAPSDVLPAVAIPPSTPSDVFPVATVPPSTPSDVFPVATVPPSTPSDVFPVATVPHSTPSDVFPAATVPPSTPSDVFPVATAPPSTPSDATVPPTPSDVLPATTVPPTPSDGMPVVTSTSPAFNTSTTSATAALQDHPCSSQFDSGGKSRPAKRKRGFFEDCYGEKRRSARVRNTYNRKKEEETTVNFQELLLACLPSSLKQDVDADDMEVKSADNTDQSADDMSSKTENTGEVTMQPVNSVSVFTSEEKDVLEFLKSNQKNSGTIVLMMDYLLYLADQAHIKWPSGLSEVYLQVYSRIRKHFDLPDLYGGEETEEYLKSLAKMCLVSSELQLDLWMVKKSKMIGSPWSSPRSPSHGTFLQVSDLPEYCMDDLWYITSLTPRSDILGDYWIEHSVRTYWMKARLSILQGEIEDALFSFQQTINFLGFGKEDHNISEIQLVNCKMDRIISSDLVKKQQESLQRYQSSEETQKLFDTGNYERVVEFLLETFTQPAKRKVVSMNTGVPERQAQLLLLQESLFNIGDYPKAALWGEVSFNEAVQCYKRASTSAMKEEWSSTIAKLCADLIRVTDKDPDVLKSLPAMNTMRLTQNLIYLIDIMMSVMEGTLDMPIGTVLPWILLYKLIKQEEEKFKAMQLSESQPAESGDLDNAIPSSLMLLNIAHDYLGRLSWCTKSEGSLLLFFMDVLLQEMTSMPSASKEELEQAFEQCIYCLYGHPNKKGKARHLLDHNAPPIHLVWNRAVVVYEYFKPKTIPEFDGYKQDTISAEVAFLLRRIVHLIPDAEKPSHHLENVLEYIDGNTNTPPNPNTDNISAVPKEIYYMLADYYFKNKEQSKAIKFYLCDICVNPHRLDSWAGMALARMSQLEQKLNATEQEVLPPQMELKLDVQLYKKSISALRCFKRAMEIDKSNTKLWIEYGSLAYQLHSHSSRQLKMKEWFPLSDELLQISTDSRQEMLQTAYNCFKKAGECDSEEQEDEWLQHYMMGKCLEKLKKTPGEYLRQYKQASVCLHEENATYPKKINYSYTSPHLAVEALEMFYRLHVSAIKQILKNNCSDEDCWKFQTFINEAAHCPFAECREKRHEKNDEKDSSMSAYSDDHSNSMSGLTKKPKSQYSSQDHTYSKQKSIAASSDADSSQDVNSNCRNPEIVERTPSAPKTKGMLELSAEPVSSDSSQVLDSSVIQLAKKPSVASVGRRESNPLPFSMASILGETCGTQSKETDAGKSDLVKQESFGFEVKQEAIDLCTSTKESKDITDSGKLKSETEENVDGNVQLPSVDKSKMYASELSALGESGSSGPCRGDDVKDRTSEENVKTLLTDKIIEDKSMIEKWESNQPTDSSLMASSNEMSNIETNIESSESVDQKKETLNVESGENNSVKEIKKTDDEEIMETSSGMTPMTENTCNNADDLLDVEMSKDEGSEFRGENESLAVSEAHGQKVPDKSQDKESDNLKDNNEIKNDEMVSKDETKVTADEQKPGEPEKMEVDSVSGEVIEKDNKLNNKISDSGILTEDKMNASGDDKVEIQSETVPSGHQKEGEVDVSSETTGEINRSDSHKDEIADVIDEMIQQVEKDLQSDGEKLGNSVIGDTNRSDNLQRDKGDNRYNQGSDKGSHGDNRQNEGHRASGEVKEATDQTKLDNDMEMKVEVKGDNLPSAEGKGDKLLSVDDKNMVDLTKTDDDKEMVEKGDKKEFQSSAMEEVKSEEDTNTEWAGEPMETELETRLTGEELRRDVLEKCMMALHLCVSRFPTHYKSLYRLAYMHYYSPYHKNLQYARDMLLGTSKWSHLSHMSGQGLFGERKQNNFFQGVWRNPIEEIDRSGSFATHLNRSVDLLLKVLLELKDVSMLYHLHLQMSRSPDSGKKYLRDGERAIFARMAFANCLDAILAKVLDIKKMSDKEKQMKYLLEVYRIWNYGISKLRRHLARSNKAFTLTYEAVRKEQINPETGVLDQAIKFCQNYQHMQSVSTRSHHPSGGKSSQDGGSSQSDSSIFSPERQINPPTTKTSPQEKNLLMSMLMSPNSSQSSSPVSSYSRPVSQSAVASPMGSQSALASSLGSQSAVASPMGSQSALASPMGSQSSFLSPSSSNQGTSRYTSVASTPEQKSSQLGSKVGQTESVTSDKLTAQLYLSSVNKQKFTSDSITNKTVSDVQSGRNVNIVREAKPPVSVSAEALKTQSASSNTNTGLLKDSQKSTSVESEIMVTGSKPRTLSRLDPESGLFVEESEASSQSPAKVDTGSLELDPETGLFISVPRVTESKSVSDNIPSVKEKPSDTETKVVQSASTTQRKDSAIDFDLPVVTSPKTPQISNLKKFGFDKASTSDVKITVISNQPTIKSNNFSNKSTGGTGSAMDVIEILSSDEEKEIDGPDPTDEDKNDDEIDGEDDDSNGDDDDDSIPSSIDDVYESAEEPPKPKSKAKQTERSQRKRPKSGSDDESFDPSYMPSSDGSESESEYTDVAIPFAPGLAPSTVMETPDEFCAVRQPPQRLVETADSDSHNSSFVANPEDLYFDINELMDLDD